MTFILPLQVFLNRICDLNFNIGIKNMLDVLYPTRVGCRLIYCVGNDCFKVVNLQIKIPIYILHEWVWGSWLNLEWYLNFLSLKPFWYWMCQLLLVTYRMYRFDSSLTFVTYVLLGCTAWETYLAYVCAIRLRGLICCLLNEMDFFEAVKHYFCWWELIRDLGLMVGCSEWYPCVNVRNVQSQLFWKRACTFL